MKYIVMIHSMGDVVQEIPIIFPQNLVHSIVASAMTKVLAEHGFKSVECVRAGDCSIHECTTFCRSSTLNLESDEWDQVMIELNDVFHGIV